VGLARELRRPECLAFARSVLAGYMATDMPCPEDRLDRYRRANAASDVEAWTMAGVLGLCLDVLDAGPADDALRGYAQRLANRALEIYFCNSLIAATPLLDYYESASGCPALAWELTRLVTRSP
jgi:hypothetical protein